MQGVIRRYSGDSGTANSTFATVICECSHITIPKQTVNTDVQNGILLRL